MLFVSPTVDNNYIFFELKRMSSERPSPIPKRSVYNELIQLVKDGDVETVENLMMVYEFVVNEALFTAAVWNNTPMVEVLLKYGEYDDLTNILKIAITHFENNGMLEVLLDYGASPNEALKIILSLDKLNFRLLKTVVEKGADIHYDNEILLRNAVRHKKEEMVHFLLEHGANPNVRFLFEGLEFSLLEYSIFNQEMFYGFEKITVDLINHGSDVEPSNVNLLFLTRNYDIIKTLLEHGADIHRGYILQNDGRMDEETMQILSKFIPSDTLLWYHILDKYEVVKLLLEYNADLHKYNDKIIRTLINSTKDKNVDKKLRLLILYGADPDILIDGGWIDTLSKSTIKTIFNTRLTKLKLGSKEAFDFWIKWAPYISDEHIQTIEAIRNQRAQVWGYPEGGNMKYDEPTPRVIPQNRLRR
jgi:ankyrin repeat protein